MRQAAYKILQLPTILVGSWSTSYVTLQEVHYGVNLFLFQLWPGLL